MFDSLDMRGGGSFKQATHAALASELGLRLYFAADDNHPNDARLQISSVQKSDGGVYRCRVDFFNSATRNVRVNLSLVGRLSFLVYGLFFIMLSIYHFTIQQLFDNMLQFHQMSPGFLMHKERKYRTLLARFGKATRCFCPARLLVVGINS